TPRPLSSILQFCRERNHMFRLRCSVTIGFAIGLLISLTPAFGQKPAGGLQFEVASIKAADPITPATIASGKLHIGMNIQGTRVDIGYMSLADLIPIAFNMKAFQVAGPEWMRDQRFDIIGKMPEGATKEQVPEMLQALLAERFQLKVHRENR